MLDHQFQALGVVIECAPSQRRELSFGKLPGRARTHGQQERNNPRSIIVGCPHQRVPGIWKSTSDVALDAE